MDNMVHPLIGLMNKFIRLKTQFPRLTLAITGIDRVTIGNLVNSPHARVDHPEECSFIKLFEGSFSLGEDWIKQKLEENGS